MKATHQGHCQVCNAIQNVQGRNAKLAKHGYKVAGYGFFNGTCPGSEHLPLEQDKTMVEWSINWANERIAALTEEIQKWVVPATEPIMWFYEYVQSNNRYIPSGYHWRRVEITRVSKVWHEGTDKEFTQHDDTFIGHDGRKVPLSRYSLHADTLLQIANIQNAKYVEFLEKNIKDLRGYIKDQQERIKVWHAQPLIPVKS